MMSSVWSLTLPEPAADFSSLALDRQIGYLIPTSLGMRGTPQTTANYVFPVAGVRGARNSHVAANGHPHPLT